MLEQIKTLIRKSVGPIFTTSRYSGELRDGRFTSAGQAVTPDKALTVASVAACVRLLSETTAALPRHVYRDLGSSKMIEPTHPVYDLLHYQPNEFMTSFTFFQQAIALVLLQGNFYAVIERNDKGEPIALWPLRSEGVTVEVAGGAVQYRYYAGGQRQTYGFRDVLHFKGPSLDGVTGLSIIHIAREGIGLSLAQDAHAATLFKNNARPGLVFKHPGVLSEEGYQRLRESLQASFSGNDAYKTAILENGMEIAPYGFSSEDSQFLESRQFSAIEVARWFRVPPTMIGDMTRVSYSSSESEMQLFAMHSLVPLCANLEAEMNLKLFPSRTQFLAKFDVNSIIRGDQAARYSAYSQGLTAGFLTVADVRSAEDLPFIKGTDMLMRPANQMPYEGAQNGSINAAA